MDDFAEEIWKDRLSSLVDTSKIKDKQSLLKEIKNLKNPAKGTQGNPEAVQQLIRHINSLFKSKTLEKTITSNIFNTTNLRELRKLSGRQPRKVKRAAIKRINTIIAYQKQVQEKKTITSTSKKGIAYKTSKPTTFTKAQTQFLKDNADTRSNRLLALQFKKRFNITRSPDSIKAKKLRLKGTKKK